MTIYERYGRTVELLENEREAHIQTIALLRQLKSGELSLDQVQVFDDNRWAFTPTVPVRLVIEGAEGAEGAEGDTDDERVPMVQDG